MTSNVRASLDPPGGGSRLLVAIIVISLTLPHVTLSSHPSWSLASAHLAFTSLVARHVSGARTGDLERSERFMQQSAQGNGHSVLRLSPDGTYGGTEGVKRAMVWPEPKTKTTKERRHSDDRNRFPFGENKLLISDALFGDNQDTKEKGSFEWPDNRIASLENNPLKEISVNSVKNKQTNFDKKHSHHFPHMSGSKAEKYSQTKFSQYAPPSPSVSQQRFSFLLPDISPKPSSKTRRTRPLVTHKRTLTKSKSRKSSLPTHTKHHAKVNSKSSADSPSRNAELRSVNSHSPHVSRNNQHVLANVIKNSQRDRPSKAKRLRNGETSLTSGDGMRVTQSDDPGEVILLPHSSRPAAVACHPDVIIDSGASMRNESFQRNREVTRVIHQLHGESVVNGESRLGDLKQYGIYSETDEHSETKDGQTGDVGSYDSKDILRIDDSARNGGTRKNRLDSRPWKKRPEGTEKPGRVVAFPKTNGANADSKRENREEGHGNEVDSFSFRLAKALTSDVLLADGSSTAGVSTNDIFRRNKAGSLLTRSPIRSKNAKHRGARVKDENLHRKRVMWRGQGNGILSISVRLREQIPPMKYEEVAPFMERKRKSIPDLVSKQEAIRNALRLRPEGTSLRKKDFSSKRVERKIKGKVLKKKETKVIFPPPRRYLIEILRGKNSIPATTITPSLDKKQDESKILTPRGPLSDGSHFRISNESSEAEKYTDFNFSVEKLRILSNTMAGVYQDGVHKEKKNVAVAKSAGNPPKATKPIQQRIHPSGLESTFLSLADKEQKDYTEKVSFSRKLLQVTETKTTESESDYPRTTPFKEFGKESRNSSGNTSRVEGESKFQSESNQHRQTDIGHHETSVNDHGPPLSPGGNAAGTSLPPQGESHSESQDINYSHFPPGFGGVDEGEGCNCWSTYDESFKPEFECRCQGEHLARLPKNISTNVDRLTITKMGIESIGPANLSSFSSSLQEIILQDVKKLEILEDGIFKDMLNLTIIYISHAPRLSSLPRQLLHVSLPRLKILRILHTGLEELPDLTQLGTQNIMHMVDLENNKIKRLRRKSIHIQTEQLLLDNNELQEVEAMAFQGSQIGKLSMKGNNQLRNLDPLAFKGVKSLRSLDLSETAITHLPTLGLEGLETLRLVRTYSLKVFPSVYSFKSILRAELTYHYHCCAFKFPRLHDPAEHKKHEEFLKSLRSGKCSEVTSPSPPGNEMQIGFRRRKRGAAPSPPTGPPTFPPNYKPSVKPDDISSPAGHQVLLERGQGGPNPLPRKLEITRKKSNSEKFLGPFPTGEREARMLSSTGDCGRSCISELQRRHRNLGFKGHPSSHERKPDQKGGHENRDHNFSAVSSRGRARRKSLTDSDKSGKGGGVPVKENERKDGKIPNLEEAGPRGTSAEHPLRSTSESHFDVHEGGFIDEGFSSSGHHEIGFNHPPLYDHDLPGTHGDQVPNFDHNPADYPEHFLYPQWPLEAPRFPTNFPQYSDIHYPEAPFGSPFDGHGGFGHVESLPPGGDEKEPEDHHGTFMTSYVTFENTTKMKMICDGKLSKNYRDVQCLPEPDAFNPCEDIMGNIGLRVAVWFVVVTAVFGNLSVMVVLMSTRFKMTVSKFLMCNLAVADLCMGIYLLLIAAMDLHTIGVYFNYAIDWQNGPGCKVAGFLTVFASELSILTLTVITLERWYAITYAIHLNKRLRLSVAVKVMVLAWLYALTMATLPLMGVSGYSKTSICLPMETHDVADQAYLLLLLATNGLAFVLICVCYSKMYCSIAGNNLAANTSDTTVAKRMALLVFTDFACWAPIAFFGLTAVLGFPLISVTHAKFLLVFFYPLNSCANPYLYAILTKQYRRDLFILLARYGFCTKRAVKYKGAYSTNTWLNHNNVCVSGGGGGAAGGSGGPSRRISTLTQITTCDIRSRLRDGSEESLGRPLSPIRVRSISAELTVPNASTLGGTDLRRSSDVGRKLQPVAEIRDGQSPSEKVSAGPTGGSPHPIKNCHARTSFTPEQEALLLRYASNRQPAVTPTRSRCPTEGEMEEAVPLSTYTPSTPDTLTTPVSPQRERPV